MTFQLARGDAVTRTAAPLRITHRPASSLALSLRKVATKLHLRDQVVGSDDPDSLSTLPPCSAHITLDDDDSPGLPSASATRW